MPVHRLKELRAARPSASRAAFVFDVNLHTRRCKQVRKLWIRRRGLIIGNSPGSHHRMTPEQSCGVISHCTRHHAGG